MFFCSARSGRVFLLPCLSLASCIFLSTVGQQHCRKSGCIGPGPCRPSICAVAPRPSPWESSGRRRGWKACRVPGAIVTRHTMNLAMMMVVFFARRRGRQPPNKCRAVSSELGFVGGGFVLFATLGFSFRFHVGRPFWLLLFLASFLACCLPSPLLSWVLPFLGFVRKWLLRWSLVLVDLFCGHLLLVFLLKTGQNAVRFCVLVFAWVRPVLAFRKISALRITRRELLAKPVFSLSFSLSFSLVACRRHRRLHMHLSLRRLDDASSPSPTPLLIVSFWLFPLANRLVFLGHFLGSLLPCCLRKRQSSG